MDLIGAKRLFTDCVSEKEVADTISGKCRGLESDTLASLIGDDNGFNDDCGPMFLAMVFFWIPGTISAHRLFFDTGTWIGFSVAVFFFAVACFFTCLCVASAWFAGRKALAGWLACKRASSSQYAAMKAEVDILAETGTPSDIVKPVADVVGRRGGVSSLQAMVAILALRTVAEMRRSAADRDSIVSAGKQDW